MNSPPPTLLKDLLANPTPSPAEARTLYVRIVHARQRLIGNTETCFLRVDDSSGYPLRAVQLKCPMSLLAAQGVPDPTALTARPARLLCAVQRSYFDLPDCVEFAVVQVMRIDIALDRTAGAPRNLAAAEVSFWRECMRARRAATTPNDTHTPAYLELLRDRDEDVQVLSDAEWESPGNGHTSVGATRASRGASLISIPSSPNPNSPQSSPQSSPTRTCTHTPPPPTRPSEHYTCFVAAVLAAGGDTPGSETPRGVVYAERLFLARDTQRLLGSALQGAAHGLTARAQYDAWVQRLVRDGLARESMGGAQGPRGDKLPVLRTGVLRRLHRYARRRVRLMRQLGNATLPVDVPQILRRLRVHDAAGGDRDGPLPVRPRGVLEAFRVVLRAEFPAAPAGGPDHWWIEGGGEHWVVHLAPESLPRQH